MAKSIMAHPAHEPTYEKKTTACSGCGRRFPHCELVEVHDEHIAFGYGVRVGERYCRPCALICGIV